MTHIECVDHRSNLTSRSLVESRPFPGNGRADDRECHVTTLADGSVYAIELRVMRWGEAEEEEEEPEVCKEILENDGVRVGRFFMKAYRFDVESVSWEIEKTLYVSPQLYPQHQDRELW